MKVKTTASEQVWQSPDKQRTIWEVDLKADDGNDYRLKTFSAEIAKIGFEGDVETYANPRGERMVRQPKQDTSYKGGGGGKGANQGVIQAQWAIGRAATVIQQRGIILPDDEYYKEMEKIAIKLVGMVDRVMAGHAKDTE